MYKNNRNILFITLFVFFTNLCAEVEQIKMLSPSMKSRVCEDSYISIDRNYRVQYPDIGKKLLVNEQIISKGITSHATFANMESGLLYIVSTKIRKGLPKDSSVLDRVEVRMKRYKQKFPKLFSGKRGEGKYGRTYEFTLINATNPNLLGNKPNPYPIAILVSQQLNSSQIDRLAVHRYFVSNGYMYEVAALLHTKGVLRNFSKDALISKGNTWLDLTVENISFGKFKGCKK